MIDKPTFSSSLSIDIILTSISSPILSSSDGFSTWSQEISETWTKPSTPSATSTNAPKSSRLTTLPFTTSPTSWLFTNESNGLSSNCLRPREILFFSWFNFNILTSILSPTLSTSDGTSTLLQAMSETWSNPSSPFTSTKAPKSVSLATSPSITWPSSSSSHLSSSSPSRTSLRDKTNLFFLSSIETIFKSHVSPTNFLKFLTKYVATWLAGMNPWIPLTSAVRPPLLNPVTWPSTISSFSYFSNSSFQLFIPRTLLVDSDTFPSPSSSLIT